MSNFSTTDGCFQKPNRFAPYMLKPRQLIIGMILILGISFSPLIHSDVLDPKHLTTSVGENTPDNQEQSDSQNWYAADGRGLFEVSLNELSGTLNLLHGRFDPLVESYPEIPQELQDFDDFEKTGMKYVQLKINDYTWIYSQQELGRISILEILGDGNFIIRLNQNVQSS